MVRLSLAQGGREQLCLPTHHLLPSARPVLQAIVRAGTTKPYKFAPFWAMATNNTIGGLYGILIGNQVTQHIHIQKRERGSSHVVGQSIRELDERLTYGMSPHCLQTLFFTKGFNLMIDIYYIVRYWQFRTPADGKEGAAMVATTMLILGICAVMLTMVVPEGSRIQCLGLCASGTSTFLSVSPLLNIVSHPSSPTTSLLNFISLLPALLLGTLLCPCLVPCPPPPSPPLPCPALPRALPA